jgi:hypothetical protein
LWIADFGLRGNLGNFEVEMQKAVLRKDEKQKFR